MYNQYYKISVVNEKYTGVKNISNWKPNYKIFVKYFRVIPLGGKRLNEQMIPLRWKGI